MTSVAGRAASSAAVVAGHLLALFMAGIFLSLGFWQLARNNHKHAIIAREKAAYAKPAPDVTSLASSADDGEPVQARGTFDATHETVLRNQVHHDAVGIDVLTPLRLSDGTAVLVNRGWVHSSAGASLTTDPPPAGIAVVHGLLHSSNTFASADTVNHLADGRLAVRVDLAAIGATLPYPLKKVWIEARAITPTPAGNSPRCRSRLHPIRSTIWGTRSSGSPSR